VFLVHGPSACSFKEFYLPKKMYVMFIPNHEFYWNTTADKFRDKMIKEYRNFWNKERIAKAAQQVNPVEATILASIVHKESVKKRKDLELPEYI
jgi:UPF0755 protein